MNDEVVQVATFGAILTAMSSAKAPLDIERLALALEPAKRLSLAARLLDSVEGPESSEWAKSWAEELDRRAAAVDSGEDPGVSWDAVRAEALDLLKKT
jgi:putative addiction module component (TIGR02574 family)